MDSICICPITWLIVLFLVFCVNGKGFNFAYTKPTTESSAKQKSGFKYDARRAVDGCYTRRAGKERCCFISTAQPNQWMAVDLTIPVMITEIVVYGFLCSRTELLTNCYESNPLWILLSNEPVTPEVYNESMFTKHELQVYSDGVFNFKYNPPVMAQHVVLKQFGGFDNTEFKVCEIEVFGSCTDYYFGEDCQRCNCANGTCDTINGTCPNLDCDPGWVGEQCALPCEQGQYGKNCSSTCDGCFLTKCHHVDGQCVNTCKRGLKGKYCTQPCEAGSWFRDCRRSCGNCIGHCNIIHGFCPNACQPGWKGARCDYQCSAGTYGNKCKNECGQCMNGHCDPVTGKCKDGCKNGWSGLKCETPCSPGRYGHKCELTCGHCEYEPCDIVTGSCPRMQCEPGWSRNNCNETCDDYTFGTNCSEKCGFCLNKEPCNVTSGQCERGCEPGYTGEGCNIARGDNIDVILYIVVALVTLLL